ncbi:hypothetical protein [Salipiger thiooxidans]|uniref:hypothetical protein n=1 Tax=Salipiger thiooxidans TaxID=282683 RepID=UPI001CD4EDE1|nr:hypothetical protein [Salipiger thiooxidans]MCA0848340.1 hypothetical protein [Salipiger thiooxidans]
MREAQVIVEAAHLRDARLAWQAAQYHRFAVHKPNDMPDRPGFERQIGENREVDLVEARGWMMAVSKKAAHGS